MILELQCLIEMEIRLRIDRTHDSHTRGPCKLWTYQTSCVFCICQVAKIFRTKFRYIKLL